MNTEAIIEKVVSDLNARMTNGKGEFNRGWNCGLEEAESLFRAALPTPVETNAGHDLYRRCTDIADKVEPDYRAKRKGCTSQSAKRWQAAWDGACVALGGDPADYRN